MTFAMPCLTVQQPWASAIVTGPRPKDIENRIWPTDLRGRIGIHAGARVDRRAGIPLADHAPLSAVLGTVEITGCHEAFTSPCDWHGCRENPWAHWPDPLGANGPRRLWHWELEHPREFVTPIPAKGALKFWTPGPSVAHLMSIADIVVPPVPEVSALPEPVHMLEVLWAKCGACEFLGEHPNAPHTWASPEDIAHAAATEQTDPSEQLCACPCAREENTL